MDEKLKNILIKARDVSFTYGIRSMSMNDISRKLGISKSTLYKYVKNKTDLVEKMMEYEREGFKRIFLDYDFEGVNAIDILLIVSKEVSKNFADVNPSITFDLKKYYPNLYQRHIDERTNFIFEKIKINLQKGISQGMYREDLSVELAARLYISRLLDLHNEDLFPPDKFSFQTLFNFMFESWIRGIARPEGVKYFEERFEKEKKQLDL
ncbi:MAG: TetR/AcrR family transcriptional regulator [Bacteroidales bacterium]|nr:TetR/AcrR family transcriptional regulator [Bacteroidales bacterium]MCF8386806.1 TetR/AcrR family transcriptional regulator [Bacteroidales bacterium]MCF8397051.1 TetR/AcrR family transcriptional regulator [Bacteroidales bacterium]